MKKEEENGEKAARKPSKAPKKNTGTNTTKDTESGSNRPCGAEKALSRAQKPRDYEKKVEFIGALKASYGIITPACEAMKISRQTYYNWREDDPEFAKAADDVQEIQGDYVESKLMQLIDAGDTAAIIYYCKTKLKKRGYTEKPLPKEEQPKPVEAVPVVVAEDATGDVLKKVESKKRYIIRLLKQQGIYSPELAMQVTIVAQLLVKTDELAAIVMTESHKPVSVELSREGNERESISAAERLYMEYAQRAQRALRALGMNTDAKNKIIDSNDLNNFIQNLQND